MKKSLFAFLFLAICFHTNFAHSTTNPYTIEIEETTMPGTPAIHSFAFAEAGGKWLFIGGRTNGLHGFNAVNSFPKQFSNKIIYVVDPQTGQTWSRNIFQDFPFTFSDQLRSANMESTQDGNKLYITGGYGYDSTSNGLITFSKLTVIDVNEMINAIILGAPINTFARQLTDNRVKIAGGELHKLGSHFYLIGGHTFTGTYRINVNNQVYSNQIRKFMINDDGSNVSISDYSALTDTIEFHRRDMNVVPAIKPDGISEYLILYGGVFKYNVDLPYLNPIYIDGNGATVDYSFEQKMTQYTTAHLNAFNAANGNMHTTFFGGTSLYYFDETDNTQKIDSLVPFIDDITTLTKNSAGVSDEIISTEKMPDLLGTNAKFILNNSVPHYSNKIIKLDQITGRTFAGYIYGGIKATLPNAGPSGPAQNILKVYITPDFPLPVELSSFTSSVNNSNVRLNWSTSAEVNNYGFDVERKNSDDPNSSWNKTGFVKGVGNSNIQKNYTFEDRNLNSGKYRYRLKQTDFNGGFEYFELSNEVSVGTPERFFLSQNYPNPFNPNTTVEFGINASGFVSLKVYDISGKEVAVLINEVKEAGFYNLNFEASNLSSGIYLYKLTSGNFESTKRMILLK